MKTLITRTITGIAYLLVLAFAFFTSKYVLIMVFSILMIIAVVEYILISQKFPHTAYRTLLPIIWIIIPILLLEYWCIGLQSTNIVVALVVILCTNDTLAYVFGSLFGKHKMFPKVSPKKSWEGFFGGLICTVVACWFLMGEHAGYPLRYFHNNIFTNPYLWMGFAFVVIIAGTLGDFAESKVKRFANQKDSGNILPGHGGVLDRIDSMLFAVPVGFIYWLAVCGMRL